jgi:hypothetical protein
MTPYSREQALCHSFLNRNGVSLENKRIEVRLRSPFDCQVHDICFKIQEELQCKI